MKSSLIYWSATVLIWLQFKTHTIKKIKESTKAYRIMAPARSDLLSLIINKNLFSAGPDVLTYVIVSERSHLQISFPIITLTVINGRWQKIRIRAIPRYYQWPSFRQGHFFSKLPIVLELRNNFLSPLFSEGFFLFSCWDLQIISFYNLIALNTQQGY